MKPAAISFLLLGFLAVAICEENYEEPAISAKDRKHWAFQPLRSRSGGSIDTLILEKLNAIGIDEFAPRPNPETILRRLHFNLIGLPPDPEEIKTFSLSDIASKIDELLARRQYGERWAQHWLDVARFAETDGFEHDKVRPDAWRYRDWVIEALNRDLPYDRFLAYQLAGDELEGAPHVATAFLLAGPDMPDINLAEERRHNVLNEVTSTVGSAFLGLTIGCAQCHDHKSDPVSQADFYRLRAFFDNAKLPSKNKSLTPYFLENGKAVSGFSVLRIRGSFQRSGPSLEPAFLRVAHQGESKPVIVPGNKSSGRRSALATWLADPKNPLVARVIVNRVWQYHFGRGLVTTPNDFGRMGERPSHPELLDWLATDLIKHGWSLKHLHRRILLSGAWQQESKQSPADPAWKERLQFDPENVLLSRRSRIRLSGEAIRDAMLTASGKLNLKSGGPGIRPPLPSEVTVTLLKNQWPVTTDETEHNRRSIYLFARRNLRYPFFDAFDRPDGNASCAKRHVSTTAPQSLTLLNSEFSDQCARNLAAILRKQATIGGQIRLAYELTLSRKPARNETEAASLFLESASLEEFALAMFNLNEFVFLE